MVSTALAANTSATPLASESRVAYGLYRSFPRTSHLVAEAMENVALFLPLFKLNSMINNDARTSKSEKAQIHAVCF